MILASARPSSSTVVGYGDVVSTRRRPTPQHTVVVDDELWQQARTIAKRRRETVSEVLRRALVEYVTTYKDLLSEYS